MKLEILHTMKGDKEKDLPTDSPEQRSETKAYIEKLLKQGTAIFLERGKKTYRVKGYDAEKDRLIVATDKGPVAAKPSKPLQRTTAVAPVRGGSQ